MGVAINQNNQIVPHKDVKDFRDGWAVMCCFGDFENEELCLSTMSIQTLEGMKTGLRMRYQSGDAVLFCATMFEHFVTKFTGEQTMLVYHTKNNC